MTDYRTCSQSHNKLGNDCLGTITRCRGLKDLNLAHNDLSGELDACLAQLKDLALLDLSHNSITNVPPEMAGMTHLRTLNFSNNELMRLPLEHFAGSCLTELLASYNKLSGVLITNGVEMLKTLHYLDISNNTLSGLAEIPDCRLPALREMDLSCNRVTSFPDVSGWDELLTLDASENQISDLPNGFTSLKRLKQASFKGNSLKDLDPHIGLMESLESLQLLGNPLRMKRYLTLATEDLKRQLRFQLEPEADEGGQDGAVASSTSDADQIMQAPIAEDEQAWPVQFGNVIDRSSTNLETVDVSLLQSIASQHDIRRLILHHNLLISIPLAISALGATLTNLNLAHNKLSSDNYLTEEIKLHELVHLDLSCNAITTLDPLITHLSAPRLTTLDISTNQISSLPSSSLRRIFPTLTTLTASDNTISELSFESIKGLTVIDLRNNDIGRLPPKIGLLDEIERLELAGNRFRVPHWTVLQKGTKAVLAWLRDKIPEDQKEGKED